MQRQEPIGAQVIRPKGNFCRKLFQILFYMHIFLIAILVIFLTIRGLFFLHSNHFHPRKWYLPLVASTACAGIVCFAWQWITFCNPARAFKMAFWVGPLLTCATGILLVAVGTAGSLAAGAIAIISAIIESLYSCWVNLRFDYAVRLLSVAIASPPAKTVAIGFLSVFCGTLYSCFLVAGIGGATASGTKLDTLFIAIILLSLAWTMHCIKNTMQVVISRTRFMQFASGTDVDIKTAFQDTIRHSMGSICIGSVLEPVLVVIRGSARAIISLAGDANEFMFSCTSCYSVVASRAVTYGNRWGFVHVGVYNKGFVQASADTWEMFRRSGLESLINSDLTSSFCFLSGVAGGALSSLVGGSWALAVYKTYATEISVYAFLIGYFVSRISMALPQASVSAYYVAYAENPENQRLDPTIPARLEQLQRLQSLQSSQV